MTGQILIVHPSRGRPEMAMKAYKNHIENCSDPSKVDYVLCLDSEDENVQKYKDDFYCKILTSKNSGMVENANQAYSLDVLNKHDFVVVTSDDILLCPGWDILLRAEFDFHGYDKCIKTFQPGAGNNFMVLPIAGSKFFIDYGSFFYPEYIGICADVDLGEWAQLNNRWVEAPHIVCEHRHHTIFKEVPIDETYKREDSSAEIGNQVLSRRRAAGFK